jgi:hypothetical protein
VDRARELRVDRTAEQGARRAGEQWAELGDEQHVVRSGASRDGAREVELRDPAAVVPPCAICGHCGREERVAVYLTHGVSVWLCPLHRGDAYLQRRGGVEFAERLAGIWAASGTATVRRLAALQAHLHRLRTAGRPRSRPGSYSWPKLREEAERRFAAGECPRTVIDELRRKHRDGPAMAPSVRTMRRWFTEARWLAAPKRRRFRYPPPAKRVMRTTTRYALLVHLLARDWTLRSDGAQHGGP